MKTYKLSRLKNNVSGVSGKDAGEWLNRICEKLLEHDPDIVEIIQFGSSVYAPEYARDVDLLVFTRRPKDYNVYLDSVEETAPPLNVDVIVAEPLEELREDFIRSVLGAFNILYGDGKYLLKHAEMLGNPTFDEAKSALRVARRIYDLAKETTEPLDKDRLFREAFDSLFHAARIAVMTYLSTEASRLLLKRMLPEPYSTQFKKFIDTLHIKYFYNGEYPESVEEFNKWYSEVEKFIEELKVKRK